MESRHTPAAGRDPPSRTRPDRSAGSHARNGLPSRNAARANRPLRRDADRALLGRFSKLPGLERARNRHGRRRRANSPGIARWRNAASSCSCALGPKWKRTRRSGASATPEETAKLPIGYLLSLEGADSILSWRHLEKSRADGLIAIGPVHYGPGIYGHGTDDEGPLTPKGRELLKEMERLGIILDATHLCDESFWDALDRYSGPVWASHHNCRALANWNRQFADDQIRALVERGAVIGMAFDAIMMVHGWTHHRSKPQDFNLKMEKICEHIDHICQIAGNAKHVGIGTDLDGGYGTEQTPMDLDSIADLRDADRSRWPIAATVRRISTASFPAISCAFCASICGDSRRARPDTRSLCGAQHRHGQRLHPVP